MIAYGHKFLDNSKLLTMKNFLAFMFSIAAIVGLSFLASNCNPKCDPVGSIELSSDNNPAGYQILIRAKPATSLLGKTISFGGVTVSDSAKKFVEGVGMVITVPFGVSGSTKLKIEDLDCSDEVAFDFIVNSKDFYLKNPNFVTPIMPEIIFPTLVNVYPSSINKAWVSPVNTDYCFWFGIVLDTIYTDPLTNKQKTIYSLNKGTFGQRSYEKTPCNGLTNDPNKAYSLNPIYGYYDTTLTPRKLFFTVDRTARNLGTEEYIGEFIDGKLTPYNKTSFPRSPNCNTDPTVAGAWILVTSKKTGRQTLIFQSPVGP
jgi:hypothetical protein